MDPRETTIAELQDGYEKGEFSVVEVCEAYLQRIVGSHGGLSPRHGARRSRTRFAHRTIVLCRRLPGEQAIRARWPSLVEAALAI